jgi:hypothetical protein
LSLEHPTATEQTIRSAANTSVLVVLSKLVLAKLVLPHTRESGFAGVVQNKLKRFMVGHLLLLSSASEIARSRPTIHALI